jgi:hypothetical protein
LLIDFAISRRNLCSGLCSGALRIGDRTAAVGKAEEAASEFQKAAVLDPKLVAPHE